MIRAIEVVRWGPHERQRVDLQAGGVTTIAGRSQSGKTSLIDAVTWCLHGSIATATERKPAPTYYRRDLGDETSVSVELSTGTVLRRVADVRGDRPKERREVVRADGTATAYATEEAWRAALRGLAADAQAVRLVLAPMAWRELAEGPGGGRPLRDLLARVCGGTSGDLQAVVAELMAGAFADGDPIDEKGAAERRRAAGVAETEARARLDEREAQRQRAAAPLAEAPAAADVAAAHAVVVAANRWDAYRQACAGVQREIARVEAAREAAARWTARWDATVAELGPEPDALGEGEIRGWRDELRRLGAEVEQARDDARAARANAERLCASVAGAIEQRHREREMRRRELVRVADGAAAALAAAVREHGEAVEAGDVCPCCRRAGWADAADTIARLAVAVEDAQREADAALAAVEAHDASSPDAGSEPAVVAMREQAEAAERDATEADQRAAASAEAAERVRAELAEHERAAESLRQWRARRAALGTCPTVPQAPDLPTAPDVMEPAAADVEAARALVRRAEQHAGQAQQQAATLARLDREISDGRATLDARLAERARLDALVAAVRAAPSELARRQLGRLGDLGPVTVTLLEAGGVDVQVDGLPWHAASRGRQIVADVWLRAGLRRALGVAALPLWIDGTESVGGQPVPAPAPAVVIATDDGDLRVL